MQEVCNFDTAKFLFKGVPSIYTHATNIAIFFMALSTECAIKLLDICNLVDKTQYLGVVLIHVSAIMNKLEQSFISRAIWVSCELLTFLLGHWSRLLTNRSPWYIKAITSCDMNCKDFPPAYLWLLSCYCFAIQNFFIFI